MSVYTSPARRICQMEAVIDGLRATEISENVAMSSAGNAETAFTGLAAHESGDTVPFYEVEGEVLALWDQLNELKLEQALFHTSLTSSSGEQSNTDEETELELKAAERECLDARAAYMLRQSVVEDVLIADPILKAVHSGANATPTERALHPLIDRRDALSIAHTNMAASLQSLLQRTSAAEIELLRTMEQNRALTTVLLGFSNKMQAQRDEAMADPRLSMQVEQVRADMSIAKKRWRIMKSVVAAVIAGSGVDWAHSDTLRDLVLDSEDDED